jgi:hypothetical protein
MGGVGTLDMRGTVGDCLGGLLVGVNSNALCPALVSGAFLTVGAYLKELTDWGIRIGWALVLKMAETVGAAFAGPFPLTEGEYWSTSTNCSSCCCCCTAGSSTYDRRSSCLWARGGIAAASCCCLARSSAVA